MAIYLDPSKDKALLDRLQGRSNGPQQKRNAKPTRAMGRAQKPAQKPAQREQDLMNAIIDLLRLRGCVAIRINSGAIPVESEKGGRRLIRLAPAGTADILCCVPPTGRMMAVECKVGDNTASAAQTQFLADVRRAGGLAIVAYSIEDVERGLERCQ
jgi:hypothetical protein